MLTHEEPSFELDRVKRWSLVVLKVRREAAMQQQQSVEEDRFGGLSEGPEALEIGTKLLDARRHFVVAANFVKAKICILFPQIKFILVVVVFAREFGRWIAAAIGHRFDTCT